MHEAHGDSELLKNKLCVYDGLVTHPELVPASHPVTQSKARLG